MFTKQGSISLSTKQFKLAKLPVSSSLITAK